MKILKLIAFTIIGAGLLLLINSEIIKSAKEILLMNWLPIRMLLIFIGIGGFFVWFLVKDYFAEKRAVKIDANNFKKYWVDTSFLPMLK